MIGFLPAIVNYRCIQEGVGLAINGRALASVLI